MIITDVRQVDSQWLTELFHMKGYLLEGRVSEVRCESVSPMVGSIIAHLRLSYSMDVNEPKQRRLFLKISKPNLGRPQQGKREVEFYTSIGCEFLWPPLVHCYDAAYCAETGQFHILLDDLVETHFQPKWPLPPSLVQCENAIDALSQFHAFWWEHPRLKIHIGEIHNTDLQEAHLRELEGKFVGFADFLGDRLSVDRRQVFEKALPILPKIEGRLLKIAGQTLIHGDAHSWNFLYPRDPNREKIRIVDWDRWRIDVGAFDLAYLIALHWYPNRRLHMEKLLIRRYHENLVRLGIANYAWDVLWMDYRISVIRTLFIPVYQWYNRVPPASWWSHIERSMMAFHDLGCLELLE